MTTIMTISFQAMLILFALFTSFFKSKNLWEFIFQLQFPLSSMKTLKHAFFIFWCEKKTYCGFTYFILFRPNKHFPKNNSNYASFLKKPILWLRSQLPLSRGFFILGLKNKKKNVCLFTIEDVCLLNCLLDNINGYSQWDKEMNIIKQIELNNHHKTL